MAGKIFINYRRGDVDWLGSALWLGLFAKALFIRNMWNPLAAMFAAGSGGYVPVPAGAFSNSDFVTLGIAVPIAVALAYWWLLIRPKRAGISARAH